MVHIRNDYVLRGADGTVPLPDVFEGRRQLIVYHFMFPPGQTDPCLGCTSVAENLPRLEHLHARDVSLAFVSRAPVEELHAYRERMGWTVPWYSSGDSGFAEEVNLSRYGPDVFGLTSCCGWTTRYTGRITQMAAVSSISARPSRGWTSRRTAASRSSRTRPRAGRRGRPMPTGRAASTSTRPTSWQVEARPPDPRVRLRTGG